MNIEELEKKYENEIAALKAMPEEVTTFNVCLLLKNFISATIAPLTDDPKMLEQFMELFAVDMDAIGYDLLKQPEPVSDEDPTASDDLADQVAANQVAG